MPSSAAVRKEHTQTGHHQQDMVEEIDGRKVVETVEVTVLPIRVAVDGGIDEAVTFSKAEKKSVSVLPASVVT